ncbi:DUF6978 family protein [Aeromicrobium sp. CF4.19]|uniref:DUF6978 family protein n=1 Tax=Aeromicrobium sp. CF4.19 TaxID=3373082 RepID=UPI003EE69F54
MARGSLRSRVNARGEPRRLKNSEAEALLASEKRIESPITWAPDGTRYVRTTVTVTTTLGENLKMTGRISLKEPGRSGWTLTWGRKESGEHPESIRRLDLRDSHPNPDGERWNGQTHKHRWSEKDNNAWAYTPDDIPHEQPGSPVTRDNYREIFEAFAVECGVSLSDGYAWSEPDLDSPRSDSGLWEVP